MKRMILLAALLLAIAPIFGAGSLLAEPFRAIRIGDRDGFGFLFATRYLRGIAGQATTNKHADTNRDGYLRQNEFLPDLNGDGFVAYMSDDNFDNRSAAETADRNHACTGCAAVYKATKGAIWTDLSLSITAFDENWPDENGPQLPNDAIFVFDFKVAKDDIPPGAAIFFNLVFGDYDINPARIEVTFATAPARILELKNQGRLDGLIQGRSALLKFDEVFTRVENGDWRGFVQVVFRAPRDPYTAFDYVELSLFQIARHGMQGRTIAWLR